MIRVGRKTNIECYFIKDKTKMEQRNEANKNSKCNYSLNLLELYFLSKWSLKFPKL